MKYLRCEHVTKKLLEEIKSAKKVLLYNYSEPYSLYPYSNVGYHYNAFSTKSLLSKDISRCLFYHLLKLKDVDITFAGADIHLQQNYQRVKDLSDSSIDINLISFPWFFIYEYYYPGKIDSCYLKDDISMPLKYNGIFLSGGRRFCRYHIMSELSKYPNFVFSNLGYIDEERNVFREVLNYKLLDDSFCVEFLDYRQGEQVPVTVYMSGDDEAQNYLFHFNNFQSLDKKYFNANLKRYKISEERLSHHLKYYGYDYAKTPWYLYNLVPDEYLESAVNFVCETQTDLATHITEKTIKNFFYKKPFLTFASKHYYKFLQESGFELYDELFDYSFDEVDEYGKRLKMYINECEKILQMDLNDLISIINGFKDKLEHNYRICEEISYQMFPEEVVDKYDVIQKYLEDNASKFDK